MNPLIVLGVQISFSMLISILLIRWYVIPKISKDSKSDILAFLLIINVPRYLPWSLFMPGQVSPEFPHYLKEIVAHGDLLSGVLALAALLLLKANHKSTVSIIWLFSIVSIIDMVIVIALAMKEKVYELALGANYFTVTVYVPILIVIQILILKIITSRKYR